MIKNSNQYQKFQYWLEIHLYIKKERKEKMEFLLQIINGLQIGSIYALISLGYTMVYGIAQLINFAHGDIIMVGAYVSLFSIPMFIK